MLSVDGGTFVGATDFEIVSGTCTINNATINVFGNPDIVKTGDGLTSWGMGVAVFNREIYGKNSNGEYAKIDVNVSNNTKFVNAVYDLYTGVYETNNNGFDNISHTYNATHDM